MTCFYFPFDVEINFQVHKTILLLYTTDFPRVIWKAQYLFVICGTVEKFEEKKELYTNYIFYETLMF